MYYVLRLAQVSLSFIVQNASFRKHHTNSYIFPKGLICKFGKYFSWLICGIRASTTSTVFPTDKVTRASKPVSFWRENEAGIICTGFLWERCTCSEKTTARSRVIIIQNNCVEFIAHKG